MILLDKPYVSDFLKQTIITQKLPVIATPNAIALLASDKVVYITEEEAIATLKKKPDTRVYTNSENSISWVEKHLTFSQIPSRINVFKDKVAFRDLIKEQYPDYFYKSARLDELQNLDITEFPFPFIIKPSVGFFSIGVYKVDTVDEWEETVSKINIEIEETKHLYPSEVVNCTDFIIEDCIEGDEYAIDCYYDDQGNLVILNILHHIFSSGKDVSDRVYITSKEIIETYKEPFSNFLTTVGNLANIQNFVLHVEVRVTPDGTVIPIEVNPMRFGGWCTTADTAFFAYGINSYEYFLKNKKPDWETILEGKDDLLYAMIVLDNNSKIKGEEIKDFDYESLISKFKKPLEIRKVNYSEFPLFGFIFTETHKDHKEELTSILNSNLKEYITL